MDPAATRTIVLTTPFGDEGLRFQRVTGFERMARVFEYEIFALSKANDLAFDKMLGEHATLAIELPDDKVRYLDGIVVEFGLVGMVGNDFQYRLLVRPWTWMLSRTTDCRIFQELSVPDILESVFAEHGAIDFELDLAGSFAPRNYCVQYRETDLDFVSRLMEEEGIYTFFRHEKGKHTLIVTNFVGAHPSVGTVRFLPQDRAARAGEEYIREWRVTRAVVPAAAALNDYNFETPSTDLKVSRKRELAYTGGHHEIYDYPGEYRVSGDGDALASVRLEELQAALETIGGVANARVLACGAIFSLASFIRVDQNRDYMVVETRTRAVNNAYESGATEEGIDYACQFTLVPGDTPWRPERSTPRPIVKGPQTAVVVGPVGEEIFVDEYGRVKVQFFWDRNGRSDDKSSCWIRVSQMWAGNQWGWVTHPRIGQEVIVDFLEGNPDDPIVTGRVYNAAQMPPYELPANKTQSGIKSHSSLKGSPANFNEFRFEDKKGSEQVFLHAEKNQDIEVENDETHWVGHDRKKTIDNDETVLVKHDRTETVDNNETITVHGMRTETVDGNETITIHQNRTETVDVNETISIGGSRTITVSKNETATVALMRTHTVGINEAITVGAAQEITVGAAQTISVGAVQAITVGANQSTTVGGNQSNSIGGARSIQVGKDQKVSVGGGETVSIAKDQGLTVGGGRSASIGKDDALKVAKNLTIDAGDSVTIKTGSASITMKKDGTIVIKGKDITIEGSGKINVKASSDVVVKGSKILQN